MTANLGGQKHEEASSPVSVPERATRPDALIAIAASAGGIQAVSAVLRGLPRDLPAAILVVQHLDPHHPSHLSEILAKRTELTVVEAVDGVSLESQHVYVAGPDRHLLVTSDWAISLTTTELVHFVRPSADLLFESLAVSAGDRAIAVVLTGSGSDGATGVRAIKAAGGAVIVQDEATSEFIGMPMAAVATGVADRILPLPEIPAALCELARAAVSR